MILNIIFSFFGSSGNIKWCHSKMVTPGPAARPLSDASAAPTLCTKAKKLKKLNEGLFSLFRWQVSPFAPPAGAPGLRAELLVAGGYGGLLPRGDFS